MAARPHTRRRAALVAFLAAAGLGLSACGEDDTTPGTGTEPTDLRGEEDLEDPYDGPLDESWAQDAEAYVGQEVTLTAVVDEVFSPESFTITGAEGTEVEPYLVVAREDAPDLTAGDEVVVAATPVDDFAVTDVEAELDLDLPDEDVEEWDGELYLSASEVVLAPGG